MKLTRLSLSLSLFLLFFNLQIDRFDALKSNRATLLFDKDASKIYAVPWPSSSAISKINNASKWKNSSLLVARKQISTATSGSTRSMIGDVSKIYRTYVYIYILEDKKRDREKERMEFAERRK